MRAAKRSNTLVTWCLAYPATFVLALVTLCGARPASAALPRATVDRPDEVLSYQVKFIYVLPSDGVDRELDIDATLSGSVASMQSWLLAQSGQVVRVDTWHGEPDIAFVRLSDTDATLAANGVFLRDVLEQRLSALGFNDSFKVYGVYYDGGNPHACGGGAWPPALVGSVGALYLKGTPPGAPPCTSNPFATVGGPPGYFEFGMLHEIFHVLGAAPTCGRNHTLAGHTSDDNADLMYAGPLPWLPSKLDAGNDDYFNHGLLGCTDIARSAFLSPTRTDGEIPPGWMGVDRDADGLPDLWERTFGLSVTSNVGGDGATGDPDADGRSNSAELLDGTHPRAAFNRFLAEGATSSFFRTRLALLNTSTRSAVALLRFLKSDGSTTSLPVPLAPLQRRTVDVREVVELASAEFSIALEADATVLIDRTMTWDEASYGSHAETGIPTASARWYLAEGSTASRFDLFYLIQNPSQLATANVQVTFLQPNGTAVAKHYIVHPKSRFNIWVNQIAEVSATDVSAVVESTNGVPIVVERAMYLSTPNQVFAAGHESAGLTAPSSTWFLAEGATGPFFDEFVLIANPNATRAEVRATFLLPNGTTLTKDYTVPATSRFNIWVDEESFQGVGKALANTAVSVTLHALNGVAFIAERSMWWPGPTFATWAEAHNSPGAAQTGTKWALAEGEVGALGAADQRDTYVLLANTSTSAGTVQVTLLFEDGTSAQKTLGVAALSRFNIWVRAEFPGAVGKRFGTIVESVGATPAQLVVERAMYSNAAGVVWAAGTNALATRLQ